MDYAEQMIDGSGGRVLEIATFGDPAARTVFFHHGTPGAASTMRLMGPLAGDGQLYFVTMSRAGYGNSSRREGRDVASVVDDVRVVLDALGRDRYVSLGWSGGGPHALACAALDAPRCMAAVTLASVVPVDVDFDWTEGMGPENIEEFALAREGGPAYEAHVAEAAAQFGTATADNVAELYDGLLSGADRAVLSDDVVREAFAQTNRDAFARGYGGFYDDDRAFFSPWGFDPAAIAVPVEVWYGDEDLMVPPTHGEWLRRNISTATPRHHPVEGHLSIYVNHVGELAAGLTQPFA
jgi:pimeloyl-ACP methyl ester carboxylesterase